MDHIKHTKNKFGTQLASTANFIIPLHILSPLYDQFEITLQLKKHKNQRLKYLSISPGNKRQKRTSLALGRAVNYKKFLLYLQHFTRNFITTGFNFIVNKISKFKQRTLIR